MKVSRELGKVFDAVARQIEDRLDQLSPISDEEVQYQKRLTQHLEKSKDIAKQGSKLMSQGKSIEAEALFRQHRNATPKRRRGQHRSAHYTTTKIKVEMQAVIVEMMLVSMTADMIQAVVAATVMRMAPNTIKPNGGTKSPISSLHKSL